MVDDTAPWFFFILGCIVVLRAIAPLSIAYTSYLLICRPDSYRLPWPLEAWAAAESLFYGIFYLYRHQYLQNPAVHPEALPIEERRILVEKCLLSIPDFEKYFSTWFLGAPLSDIKRENLKEFFRWAFFNTGAIDAAHDHELDEYVEEFERRIGTKFEPGRSDVKCQRLSIDNTNILHRSLWWYTCVGVVDLLTWLYLKYYKFHFHHSSFARAFSRLPLRPWTIINARRSPATDLSYWHRPHTSKDRLPVLFLHGVGVGLYPYLTFLTEINQKALQDDGEIGILAVELPHISSTMGSAAPDRTMFCKQLSKVLRQHEFDRFVLISHSFGTFVSSQLLQDDSIAKKIDSVILIDPVSILLHLPDVANNFMLRRPKSANEWQLWYFGSKDAGVAHTLSRRFFWSENILWKETIDHYNVTVFLSERDLLVNTAHIHEYLSGSKQKDAELENFKKSSITQFQTKQRKLLNVIRCPNMDHGQLFDSKAWRLRLIKTVHSHSQT